MLPNTFIAGAQKSGTTALCHALDCHPQAIVSTPKEPAFFSREVNLKQPERYLEFFQSKLGATPRVVVDGSNAYMVDPLAPPRIRSILGEDLHFVFCLREPVARMVSGFWHQAKKGRERRPLLEALSFESCSLDEAVREEEENLQKAAARGRIDLADCAERFDDPLWNFRYLRNSLYAADLARFEAIFGSARLKIVFFEEFVGDPMTTLSSVAQFLNIDPTRFPAKRDLHRNATELIRAPRFVSLLQRLPRRELLRRMPGYEQVRRLVYYRPPPIDVMVRCRLSNLIAPEVLRLQTFLDRDLASIWGRAY